MDEIMKLIGWAAFSGIKFFIAIPGIVAVGYSYWETILISIIGGLSGFFIFFYFGELLKRLFKRIFKKKKNKEKKAFTKKNRRIIHIKSKYGLIGLALLTPCLLSIPLGGILAGRYFDGEKKTIPVMVLSIVIWSFVLTSFYQLF